MRPCAADTALVWGYTTYVKYTLEKHRVFPIVAWTLIIGFVFFTYNLTLNLSDTAGVLEAKTQQNIDALGESTG